MAPLRRVTIVVAPVLFIDALLFSVLAPLLPHYVDALGLSTAAAGVLSGAFAAGNVAVAIAAGALATRTGGKRTLLIGLVGLGASSVLFGVAHHIALLDAARFLQGASGSAIWAGGLTWAAAIAPDDRRATVLGGLMGVGIAGALFGPLLGALAVATSPTLVFAAIPVVLLVPALAVLRAPDARALPASGSLASALRRPFRARTTAAAWLVLAPAVALGLLGVLGPLRLAAAGAGAAAIAAVFVASGGLEAAVNPIAGRVTDRLGARRVLLAAFLATACLYTAFAFASGLAPLVALIVAISAGLGVCWAPATVRLHDVIRHAGAGDGHAFALYNLAWAGGQMVGASGGGGLAQLSGDVLPCVLTSAALLLTFAALARPARELPALRSPDTETT